MYNIDYFGGIIRFNPVLISLDLFLILTYFYSWYRSYKKTGWKLDFWNFTMFLIYFVPFLLMYPFAGSELNILAVGNRIATIQNNINSAYLISLTGYMSMYVGKYIFNVFSEKHIINYFFIIPFQKSITRLFVFIVSSSFVRTIAFITFALLLGTVLLFAFKDGQILNPRGFFQSNDNIRPVYNLMIVVSSIVAQILITRIFVYNLRSDKIILGFYILISLLIGARGSIVYPIIQLFTYRIYLKKAGKISLFTLCVSGLTMLLLVSYLGALREGDTSISNTVFKLSASTFYGNSFSDLRDFAWVLSAWDGSYLLGKTYLSALISFIPSALSSFRAEWGIGKVTAKLAGFDPLEHPGLRPGLFGEPFLNLGIVGVIMIGIMLGYAYSYIDYYIKKAEFQNKPLIAFTASISCIFLTNLPITPGFFSIYSTLMIFVILAIIKIIFNSIIAVNKKL